MIERDLILALEEPLAHAMGLHHALRLMGYGLRAQDSEQASAILALAESLEHDHQGILRLWRSLLTSRTTQQPRKRR
jgi:hypothetical protein